MTFTQTFGGSNIYPADVSYRAVSLTADTALSWPTEIANSTSVVSQIMDVTATSGPWELQLPPANQASVGETSLIVNVGSNAFTVTDTSGNTIVSIAAGLAYQIYMTDNSTPNGLWRVTQYGAGTSSATAGSLIGAGIKAINTTLNQSMSVTTVSSDYTIGEADRSEAFVWTGGAGVLTLPTATSVGNDWFCHVRNNGLGAVAVTPQSSELINGNSSLLFNPGDSAIVMTDGVAFYTVGFGQSAQFAFDYVSIDLTPQTSPYILSGSNLNRISYNFSGTWSNDMIIVVPSTVQQYWISNSATLSTSTVTVKTAAGTGVTFAQNARGIVYCNGTNVIDADTSTVSLPVSVANGGTGAVTASAARVNLGGTSTGINVFTAASATVARAAIDAAAAGANTDITSLSGLTTALSADQGGTGQSTYAVGDILYASTSSALSRLADVATGSALISGGVGVAPSWGKVGLTTHVSGILPVDNGGTGATTLTGVVIGNGSSAMTTVTAPSGAIVGTTDIQTLTNKTLTSPTINTATITTPTITSPTINTAPLPTVSGTAPLYMARAWVNFNGTGVVAIRGSGNVTSITDSAVGVYVVNFTTSMPDTNYSTVGSCGYNPSAEAQIVRFDVTGRATGSCQVITLDTSGTGRDTNSVNFVLFR